MANSLADLAQRATQPRSPQIDFNAPPQPTLPANPANPNYSMLARLASATNQAYVQPAWDKFSVFGDVASGKASMADPATQQRVMGAGAMMAGPAPEGALGAGFQFRFPKGIIAYHGSPHTFEQFDPAKIGAGEGAQAYGHGLYFAENEGVARGYRERLSPKTPHERTAFYYMQKHNGNKQDAIEDIQRSISIINQGDARMWGNDPMLRNSYVNDLRSALDHLNDPNWQFPGSTYQVRLHADPEEFLHWNDLMSEQSPLVQQQVEQAFPGQLDMLADRSVFSNPTGQTFHNFMAEDYHPAEIAEQLQSAGIPGIRYLDRGSRIEGQGTHNYVVFNPQIIDILKRYGLTGPGLAALAYMANQQRNAAPPSQ